MKKTICVDLDGVLADYDGWKGIDHIGDPIEGAKEFLEKLKKDYIVSIFTTRCNPNINKGHTVEELAAKVKIWLDKNEMPYDNVYTDQGKPLCEFFIDDRALNCMPLGEINPGLIFGAVIACMDGTASDNSI